MSVLYDRDPGDEDHTHHEVSPSDGLCARPYCDDAALPGDEFCKPCLIEIEAAVAEFEERVA